MVDTGFFLVMSGLGIASGILHFAATAKLAKWLLLHHREVWRGLGRPGTTFFKGEPDNGCLRSNSALRLIVKGCGLTGIRERLSLNWVA